MLNAIIHVNHLNKENLTYKQHVILISGLYNFHCSMWEVIKPPVYKTRFAYFQICRVPWKVGMAHRHPYTEQHTIKPGGERTDNLVTRSDLCLINPRTVPVDPLHLIYIRSATTGRLQV